MTGFWAWFWVAVWPNLVASMIWGTPAGAAFIWHHVRLSRRLEAHGEQLREAHRLLADLHGKHGPTAAPIPKTEGGGPGGFIRD